MGDPHLDPHDEFDRQFQDALQAARPKADFVRMKRALQSGIRNQEARSPWWQLAVSLPALGRRELMAACLAVCVVVPLAYLRFAPSLTGSLSGDISIYNPFRFAWTQYASSQFPMDTLTRVESTGCSIVLDDGSELELRQGTLTKLTREHGTTVEIYRGRLDADIQPQPPDKPFVVRMPPDGELTVVGTRFAVIVEERP